MSHKKTLALAIAMATAASTPAFAEWSSEPATSAVQVIDKGRDPRIATDNDGGTYVSYRNGLFYDAAGYSDVTGFDVFLQHFDANGNQSWETPLRVFDTSKKSASDYAVVTDEDGNAYVANDIYPGAYQDGDASVQVAKVNQDGTTAWATPLNLTPGSTFESNGGRITMGAQGDHIAVAWSQGGNLTIDGIGGLAMLDKSGKLLWKKDLRNSQGLTFVANPVFTEDGVFAILEVGAVPGVEMGHYYVQKYALDDGTPMWEKPVPITSGDNFVHQIIYANTVNMQFVPDGEGGVVMSWYHITGFNQGMVLLQHIHANGEKEFPGQGLRVSGDELGNGSTSLAYDGDNTYIVWPTHKSQADAEGYLHDYFGVRGVAISREGEFIWSEDGAPEPLDLMPLRKMVVDASLPQDEWFRGYNGPNITLNQDGKINFTYGEETNLAYRLYTQVVDPATGANDGERILFSDGAIRVSGNVGYGRTIFGQPVMAYALDNGARVFSEDAVRLVNFDGSGHSGVSEEILVEKKGVVTLAPGQQKSLELKVLDNAGAMHDNVVNGHSPLVSMNLSGSDTQLHLDLGTASLLADTVPVTVKVQDTTDSTRAGTSTIKIRAPYSVAPTIAGIADVSVKESESVVITAELLTAPEGVALMWEQTSGPAVAFESDGAQLTVTSDYVQEDTQLVFTVTATDGMQQASQSVEVLVSNTGSPAISGSDTKAEPGAQFTLTPTITGAKAPVSLSWSQTDGVSTVYTESVDGVLTGTAPLTEGTVVLTLNAEDANGESFSEDFTLTVAKPEITKKKSGGSFGFPAAILLGLAALIRRRFGKSN